MICECFPSCPEKIHPKIGDLGRIKFKFSHNCYPARRDSLHLPEDVVGAAAASREIRGSENATQSKRVTRVQRPSDRAYATSTQ